MACINICITGTAQCAAATGGDQVLFAPARELADNNDSGYAKPILSHLNLIDKGCRIFVIGSR